MIYVVQQCTANDLLHLNIILYFNEEFIRFELWPLDRLSKSYEWPIK